MAHQHRSVRVDSDLLATLEELARRQRMPTTFTDRVDTGLRLLVDQAARQQLHHATRGRSPPPRHITVGLYAQIHRPDPDRRPRSDGAALGAATVLTDLDRSPAP